MPQVLQPTKYIKQAQLKKIQVKTAACQNVDQEPSRMIPSLLLNELELLTVMLAVSSFMVPLRFHTEYIPIVTTQLDTGATMKCKVPFDILESAPWPIIDGNTCIKQGWISLGSDQHIRSSTTKQYEPLSFDKLMRDYDDVFTGLGCLPGEYEVDPDIKPVQHACIPDVFQCLSKQG